MVSIEELKKLELIIAQIKEVKEHPNADKLYVLKIDTGKEEKQLVAGIRLSYAPEQLVRYPLAVPDDHIPVQIHRHRPDSAVDIEPDTRNRYDPLR